MKNKFSGLFTALITPFKEDKSIDFETLEDLIEQQNTHNINGLLILGTTGESPVINHKEANQIIKTAVEKTSHKTKIIVGTGSNNTKTSIENSKIAADLGADAVLLISPYYNKPTQEGLYHHFIAVAESTNIPILLYNVAARTGVNIETNTLLKLSKHKNIVGVKESSGNILQVMDIIQATDNDFAVLSGDDALTHAILTSGGHGVISVLSNIMPQNIKNMIEQIFAGNTDAAQTSHYKLYSLMKALLTLASNPIPIKTLLAHTGRINEVFRLPLTNIEKHKRQELVNIYNKIIND